MALAVLKTFGAWRIETLPPAPPFQWPSGSLHLSAAPPLIAHAYPHPRDKLGKWPALAGRASRQTLPVDT